MNIQKTILSGVLSVLMVAPAWADSDSWELARSEDGINVYLKTVEGTDFKAYRGEAIFPVTIAQIQEAQDDVPGSCQWIYNCESMQIEEVEGKGLVIYSRYKSLGPVSARDSVVEVTLTEKADGGLERKLVGQPNLLPEEKGYVRIPELNGSWQLTPVEGGVQVVYEIQAQPGGDVPAWVANKFVVDAPFNTLRALRAHVEGVSEQP